MHLWVTRTCRRGICGCVASWLALFFKLCCYDTRISILNYFPCLLQLCTCYMNCPLLAGFNRPSYYINDYPSCGNLMPVYSSRCLSIPKPVQIQQKLFLWVWSYNPIRSTHTMRSWTTKRCLKKSTMRQNRSWQRWHSSFSRQKYIEKCSL